MSINCESITNITINGSNKAFGGYIYNLSMSLSYNSSSEFEVSFVSDKGGIYNISKNDLSSENPSILSINGKKISVLPISYNISKSPSGNLLSVKYKDLSVKYLDKILVGLRGIHVTNEQEDDYEKIISIGRAVKYSSSDDVGNIEVREVGFSFQGEKSVYSVDQLLVNIQAKGIPVTGNFIKALRVRRTEYRTVKDFHGNLRSVLQSWGSELGYLFFWNFLERDGGALDAIQIRDGLSSSDAEKLSNEIKSTYYKYITSYDYGESIEDGYTKNGTFLTINSVDSGGLSGRDTFTPYNVFGELLRQEEGYYGSGSRRRAFIYRNDPYPGQIDDCHFYLILNGKAERMFDTDFRSAVAAASLGSDFYKSFVLYCMNCYIRDYELKRSKYYSYIGLRENQDGELVEIYDPYAKDAGGGLDYSYIIGKYYFHLCVGDMTFAQEFSSVSYLGWFDKYIVNGQTKKSIFAKDNEILLTKGESEGTAHPVKDFDSLPLDSRQMAMEIKNDEATVASIRRGIPIIVSTINIYQNIFENIENDELFIQLSLYARYSNRFYFRDNASRSAYQNKSYNGDTKFFGNHLSTAFTPLQELASYMAKGNSVQTGPFVVSNALYTNDLVEPVTDSEAYEEGQGIILYDGGSKINLPDKLEKELNNGYYSGYVSKMVNIIDSQKAISSGWVGTCKIISSDLSEFFNILKNANVLVKASEKKIKIPYTKVNSNVTEGDSYTEIYRRLINNLNDEKVSENELSLEEAAIEELAYSKYLAGGTMTLGDVIEGYAKKSFHVQNEPSYFSEFSMATIPTLDSSWFRYGLDSLSISYGPDGISSNIRISTQKRASETLDMIRNNLARSKKLTNHAKSSERSTWKFPPRMKSEFRR